MPPTLEPAALDVQPMPQRRGIPAWTASVFIHFCAFITFALCVRAVPKQAPGTSPERQSGVVLVRSENGKFEYTSDDANDSNEAAAASPQVDSGGGATLPQASDLKLDVAGLLPTAGDLGGTASDAGETLLSASDLVGQGDNGILPTQGIGSKATTQVFGLQGTGTKFVYVFDRSGSMSGYGGRPLKASKGELIKSLAPLESVHQFQIIFYNERTSVFNPLGAAQPRLMFGNDTDKGMASRFIQRITALGGTEHIQPLKLALAMSPDVIFFLTDANQPELTNEELAQIRRWNRSATVINAIEFGAGPFDGEGNFLVKLAAQNHGQHVYVDVTKLAE